VFFIKIDEKEENGKDILLIATRDTMFQNSNMKEQKKKKRMEILTMVVDRLDQTFFIVFYIYLSKCPTIITI
jgi:hypothetical protein